MYTRSLAVRLATPGGSGLPGRFSRLQRRKAADKHTYIDK